VKVNAVSSTNGRERRKQPRNLEQNRDGRMFAIIWEVFQYDGKNYFNFFPFGSFSRFVASNIYKLSSAYPPTLLQVTYTPIEC